MAVVAGPLPKPPCPGWQAASSERYPIAVTIDGTRALCRARDASHALGTVQGERCVGKTYAGEPLMTADFERLLQAR